MDDASKVGKHKTNSEIRRLYLERIAAIVGLNQAWTRRELSTRDRAERAWRVRHEARRAARAMMADKRERELLRARDMIRYGSPDGPSFEFLIARLKHAGLEGDAAYEAIIDSSYRTDSELDRLLGLQSDNAGEITMSTLHNPHHPPTERCFEEEIVWTEGTDPSYPYRAELDGAKLLVRVNDFPDENLYTLVIDDLAVAGFDDWPGQWIRPGETKLADAEISVFLPVYNEQDNIEQLNLKLTDALERLDRSYEVIYVDDGSTDHSLAKLREIAARDARVRVVSLRRNYGQTAAMSAGIDHARGQILVPMDADLQNDPADISRLLEKLDEGYDVVSGWRKDRKDKWLTRQLPSRLANRLVAKLSGVDLHDFGCSLKAYRRDALTGVKLYGEMHRFIPIYAGWAGARVAEIPVTHHARGAGESKYGLSRTIKVFFDLITIKFLSSYLTKPLYLFGSAGLVCLVISLFSFAFALYYRIVEGVHLNRMPLATLSMIMFAMGVQFIFMGLLAEMIVRTYHESQDKPTYLIRERINIDDEREA